MKGHNLFFLSVLLLVSASAFAMRPAEPAEIAAEAARVAAIEAARVAAVTAEAAREAAVEAARVATEARAAAREVAGTLEAAGAEAIAAGAEAVAEEAAKVAAEAEAAAERARAALVSTTKGFCNYMKGTLGSVKRKICNFPANVKASIEGHPWLFGLGVAVTTAAIVSYIAYRLHKESTKRSRPHSYPRPVYAENEVGS